MITLRRRLAWLFVLCLAVMAASGVHAQDSSASAPTGGAAVAPPDGARPIDRAAEDFTTYPLITDRIAQRGGINGNISATRTVEGSLIRHTYRFDPQVSLETVVDAYDKRLGTGGFDVLYRCAGAECGPTFLRASPGYRAHADLFGNATAEQHYLSARRIDQAGDTYVGLQIAPSPSGVVAQLDTLRVKPREISAISVNAEQMARDLDNEGRVALYGIFFNTDSAEIKPESKPTLDEIAQLLANRPRMRLLVVGHTDSRGSFDYNIDLSSRRAAAVVDALVSRHGIDRDRLKPWGVGYTVPRASNDSDVGQAKNRRVELVIW
ncbi:OmpA family protein [Salinisphaera sp. T31B1]|uniref:OmpA family protein n=1 Tax=Salinisphaera sp. T31B1 TaxID=727963 RepID=UPI0033425C66